MASGTTEPLIGVQSTQPVSTTVHVYEIREVEEDAQKGLLPCAIAGCILSFIPIVGWVTWIVNYRAPVGSSRRAWASAACAVASLVAFFNIFFWSFMPRPSDDHHHD
ncbi:hypothetical protein EON65_45135 [archaeon]|nr:MAG: hypothetical protein EON65_45135 [archaeon]